jgi:uncharacterized protein YvpB
MPDKQRSTLWLKILTLVILAGILGVIAIDLLLSGYIRVPFTINFNPPTPTVIDIAQFFEAPATPTPFQPLPTFTLTPTGTPTAIPTATPTRTPKPTKTPMPAPTQPEFVPNLGGSEDSALINGIYGFNQTHSLSCESRSAVDWAAFYGVTISENTFQNNLPTSDDPDAGFVGSPDGGGGQIPPYSYGVHADPVAALLRSYGLEAKAVHGYSFDDLRGQVASGNPVIVWVYGNVWSGGSPVAYTALDGNTTTVLAYEHTVIVFGYDANSVWILDGGVAYMRTNSVFKDSWSNLGNMAVIKD